MNTFPSFSLPLGNNRIYFQHYALKTVLGSNILAPLSSPCDILDVGCGEGLWALDVAQSLPSSRVVGLDRGFPRPFSYHDPFNFLRVSGDLLDPLPFADMSFDYVHQRCLSPVVPASQWAGLISELIRVTRPGGWIEVVEYGSTYTNAGPNTQQFLDWWNHAAPQHGFDPSVVQHLEPLLRCVGIAHIEQKPVSLPLGRWGGEIGVAMSQCMQTSIRNLKPRITPALKVRACDFDQVVDALPTEWQAYRATYEFSAVYGQRPYAHMEISAWCAVAASI